MTTAATWAATWAAQAQAAQALAAALTRARIPATTTDPTGMCCHAAQVDITINGDPHTLYLEQDADTVLWQLFDAYGQIPEEGQWPAPRVRMPGRHRRTVRHVRAWLTQHHATPGHPAPTPIPEIIRNHKDTWEWPVNAAAELYARALVGGQLAPTDDTEALARIFADQNPELAEEVGPDAEAWDIAVESIKALAHGWIVDELSPYDQSDYEGPCCWYVEETAPDDVERLRRAFGGDLRAAAAFLAANDVPRRRRRAARPRVPLHRRILRRLNTHQS
ncbi:hypothetical protein ACFV1W_39590 [Kitasatospora sp. NPDC059648]|uniref:hypothetical protein n=1 Tax=Kitasatospora sp. NPDC059648 TaxID=3346894 RepID=UPI0036864B0E